MRSLLFTALVFGLTGAAASAPNLEPVIVTATRMTMPVDETLSTVIVIDREQIDRSLAVDVAELLRFHAGLEIGRNGGPGQTTSLFIRGTESNHALVLVDGIELNPGTLGGAALQNISPRNIERIEVVKGPRSSLYGSEAIGGVVNIITRETEGLVVRAGAGPYATRELSISGGMQGQRGALSASVSSSQTDGYPTRLEPGLPDRGFENRSAGLNGRLAFGTAELSLRHFQSAGDTEYLDFFLQPLDQDYFNRATALGLSVPTDANWTSTVTLSQIVDDIDQNQTRDFATTTRDVIDWHNTFTAGNNHALAAGLYVAREQTQALSFGTYFNERTDANAIYVEDYMDFGKNRLLLAARYSDHDSFGKGTTYNAELGHDINSTLRVTVATGTGFRAPDATDRFGYGGNPDLEAETSRNLELGLRGTWNTSHSTNLQLYRNEIDDLIDFVFDPLTFAGGNLNVAKARISGIELRHDWQQGPWQMTTTALVQDPKDRQTGQQLARRAKRSLTVNVSRDFGAHSLGLDVLATSERRDSPFSDIVNAGYVLANLAGRFSLNPRWSLHTRIENLFDTHYETAAGFRSADRGLHLAAQYQTR